MVGVWKLLFLRGGPFVPDPSKSAQWNRGAYLVNGPGHCAECHSPRNLLGGIIESERFAGGPTPDGEGWVPNITPTGLAIGAKENIAWSEKDIASFLDDGMMPDGDYAGGAMAEVIRNVALLSRRRPRRNRRLHRLTAADPRAYATADAAEEGFSRGLCIVCSCKLSTLEPSP